MRNAAKKTQHNQQSAAESPGWKTQMAPIRLTAVILTALWALAVATSYMGRYVHLLAIAAVALLLIEFVMKRRTRH